MMETGSLQEDQRTASRNSEAASRPIIILGVDRSGTSLVAELVHRWGGFGGDSRLLSENDHRNPRGYWEDRSLSDFIHDEVTRGEETPYWYPHYEDSLKSKALDPQFRKPALDLISGMSNAADVWFWKEPLLSIQLPFWKDLWGSVSYVITVRNPHDSAVSWNKFNAAENHRGVMDDINVVAINLLRWQYYMLAILRHTSGSPRIFLCYEDLIEDPERSCAALCDFLDRRTDRDGRGEGKIAYMAQAVDSRLWRNRSRLAFSEVEEATEAQKGLYRLLLRMTRDPAESFRPEDYPMVSGWREFLNNYLVFRIFYDRATKEMASPLVRPAVAVYRVVTRLMERISSLW